jgi:hypothetical protein
MRFLLCTVNPFMKDILLSVHHIYSHSKSQKQIIYLFKIRNIEHWFPILLFLFSFFGRMSLLHSELQAWGKTRVEQHEMWKLYNVICGAGAAWSRSEPRINILICIDCFWGWLNALEWVRYHFTGCGTGFKYKNLSRIGHEPTRLRLWIWHSTGWGVSSQGRTLLPNVLRSNGRHFRRRRLL